MANGLPSLRNGSWYRCADGSIVEPLDILHLIFFPSYGRDARGDNVCSVPKHMTISYLADYIPDNTELYLFDDLVDATIALLMVSFVVVVGFIGGKYLWEVVDKQFNEITPSHKKWYVVANISKSFFAGCLAVSPKFWISFYKCQVMDDFQLIELKRTMCLYMATDLVALFMVPKLPTSTILHHVVTTVMGLFITSLNLQAKGRAGLLGFGKMGLVYGSLSSIPFLVNAYLGLRVVYPKSFLVKLVCYTSLVTYLVCCGFNWTIHLLWLLGYWGEREVSVITLVYMLMNMFLVHDDIVLLRWLVRKNSPVNTKRD